MVAEGLHIIAATKFAGKLMVIGLNLSHVLGQRFLRLVELLSAFSLCHLLLFWRILSVDGSPLAFEVDVDV